MGRPLRVLMVEDRPDDALLVVHELRRGGYDCAYRRVETAMDMAAALADEPWDAVLADYRLPEFSAIGALEVLKDCGLDLPFIIVSGTIDEESAVEALRAGAHDFVTKARLARLVPAVGRELREATNRRERILAQEQLRELQGTLTGFYRAAPVLMGVVDLVGTDDILHVFDNPATEQFFEAPRGSMAGLRASELGVPTEVREMWVHHYRQSLVSGEPQRFEYWHPSRKDGRCLRVTVAPIPGEESAGDRFCYVAEDVSLSKSFDDELGRRERRFRSLIENASDVISILDAEGRLIFGSPSMEQVLGYSPEERMGRPVFEQIHPDDGPGVRAVLEHTLANPGTHHEKVTARYRHRDGSWRVLEAIGTNLLDDESVRGIVVNVRDITEKAQAEAALRDSEIRYRTLVETLPVGVVVVDPAGKVVSANQAAARILGVEILQGGADFPRFTASWGRDGRPLKPEECTAARAMSGERFDSPDELRIRGLNGAERTVLAHGAPLRSRAGEVTGAVVSLVDITDARNTEAQLRQAQKMEAVGRVAGGIAHDFNNVLTAIQGHASFLAESLPPGDSLGEDVGEILRSTERAASLTRQLLAFSRKQLVQPVFIDLREAVAGMHRMIERLLGEDIVVEIQSADEPCVIHADPGQIEQVILNLAVNARDAMPDGGRLVLSTGRGSDSNSKGPASVVLTVADEGCGIPPELLPKIFEPFFTTKPSGMGTGLGLATVYGIIDQAGGNIAVLSNPGKGTTFTVVLPRKNEAPVVKSPVGKAAAGATGSETILVVEDEDAVRSLVRRALNRSGYQVIEAGTGDEALAAIERVRGEVDLVLTDVVMPHLSGRELMERIGRKWPATRVLFMSGYTEDEVLRRGVASTGLPFLQKPFTPAELVRTVRDALDVVAVP